MYNSFQLIKEYFIHLISLDLTYNQVRKVRQALLSRPLTNEDQNLGDVKVHLVFRSKVSRYFNEA